MRNTHASRTVAAALISFSWLVEANAVTVYQESVDGDAPPLSPTGSLNSLAAVSTTPNVGLGILSGSDRFTIVGSVEGGTIDNVDIYEFSILSQWRANLISYTPGEANSDSAFRLHSASATTLAEVLVGHQIGVRTSDIFGPFNDSGTYRISIFESGSRTPANYAIEIVPIPEPAFMTLIGLGSLGLFASRRRTPQVEHGAATNAALP